MNPNANFALHPARIRLTATLAALGVLGVLGACATPQPTYPELESAHSALAAARAAPDAHYADLELKRADDFLHRADAAAAAREPALVAHYAYLAEQQTRIALEIGAGKAADEYVAHGDEERQRIQLAARTRELNAARAEAQQASAEAQAAADQAQAVAADRDRLQDELSSLQAKQSPRGTVITLKDMVFETGQAVLQPGAERTLDALANALKDTPQRAVAIEGFTDSVGDAAFNQQLSERRAEAVRDALQQRGIDASRIVARGYGEQFPVASNATPAGRQLNRRVEIIVSDAGSQVAARSM